MSTEPTRAQIAVLKNLDDLKQAADWFLEGNHWLYGFEERATDAARRLARVLARLDDETVATFPRRIVHLVRRIRESFAELIKKWEWGNAVDPDGYFYVQEQIERYRRDYLLPFWQAALSLDEGLRARDQLVPPEVSYPAREAEQAGLSVALSYEEALVEFPKRRAARHKATVVGKFTGLEDDELVDRLRRAKGDLWTEAADYRKELGLPPETMPNRHRLIGVEGNTVIYEAVPDAPADANESEVAVLTLRPGTSPPPPLPCQPEMPSLSRVETELIKAAYRLRAFDRASLKTRVQILREHAPGVDRVPRNISSVFANLRPYFGSRKGPSGGMWLNERGRAVADDILERERRNQAQ